VAAGGITGGRNEAGAGRQRHADLGAPDRVDPTGTGTGASTNPGAEASTGTVIPEAACNQRSSASTPGARR